MYANLNRSLKKSTAAVEEYFQAHARGCVSPLLAALKANGINEEQSAAVNAIIGKKNSVGAPVASNVRVLTYAAERLGHCLSAVLAHIDGIEAQLVVLTEHRGPTTEGAPLDMRELKANLARSLKRDWDHFFVSLFPVLNPLITLEARAIVWGPKNSGKRRNVRSALDEEISSAMRCPIRPDPVHLQAAAAALFDPSWLGTCTAAEEIDPEKIPSFALIGCFMARAMTSVPQACFAYGTGRAVLKCVTDEIKARARSLDVGRRSPVQLEGIASALADLPGADERRPLPVVFQL